MDFAVKVVAPAVGDLPFPACVLPCSRWLLRVVPPHTLTQLFNPQSKLQVAMAPRAEAFKRLRQRLRRSLRYGSSRMNCLTIPLSRESSVVVRKFMNLEMVVDYFDHHSPYDYLDMDFAVSLSR